MTDSSDYTAPTLIHRCINCGKWSHAKKAPKTHKGWVKEGHPGFNKKKGIGATYDPYGYEVQPDGHEITCGPFITYFAATLRDLEDV